MSDNPVIRFEFELHPFDSSKATDLRLFVAYDLEGDFTISVDNRTLCGEPYFPVAEFAVTAASWADRLKKRPDDLVYQPEGYDPDYFVKFCRVEGGWKIVPFNPEYDEDRVFSGDCLISAVQRFLEDVTQQIKDQSQGKLDITPLLSEPHGLTRDDHLRCQRLYSKLRNLPFPELGKRVGDFGLYESMFVGVFSSVLGGWRYTDTEIPTADDETLAFVEQLRKKAAKLPEERKFLEYFDIMEEMRRCYLNRK